MTRFDDFFAYAVAHGLALFPCEPGTKHPVTGFKWKHESSRDPATWAAWLAEDPARNIAVNAQASGLLIVDVDASHVGPEAAWAAWEALCAEEWGLPDALWPYAESARGGWHILIARPADVEPDALHGNRPGFIKDAAGNELIGVKNRGYVIAAGSYYDGSPKGEASGWYALLVDGAPPHPCPPGLLDAMRLPVREASFVDAAGKSDAADLAAVVAALDAHGEFSSEPEWFKALGAIKLALGDTEAGIEVARQITFVEVTDAEFFRRWNYHTTVDTGERSLYRVNSLIYRAKLLTGRKFDVRKSAAAMFDAAAQAAIAAAGPTPGARSAVVHTAKFSKAIGMPIAPYVADAPPLTTSDAPDFSLVSGNTAILYRLAAPILAKVPRVERTPAHPVMPGGMERHPLAGAILDAIPGIMESGDTDALAVVHTVAPELAAALGEITSTVRARAAELIAGVQRETHLSAGYTRDRQGVIESNNPDNLAFFLKGIGVEIRFNEWIERVELRGWVWDRWTALDDAAVAQLRRRAGQTGTRFTPAVDWLWSMLLAFGYDNRVDPAIDRLAALEAEWDGVRRLATWLSVTCGVPPDAYHQAVGTSMLLGLVARIRKPGVKYDLATVFISEIQGKAKSTLARMLAIEDDWFVENVTLGAEAKELVLLLAGKTVAEISEMRTRGEVDAAKAMISATHDEGRPAYGRVPVKRARRNIFIGTTNRPEFLEDPTGGRRFLPVTVLREEIDLVWLGANRLQLIGEAAALQSRGVDINIPRDVWAVAAEHQRAATAVSSTEVLLEGWFDGEEPAWIAAADLVLLLRQALGRDPSRGSYAVAMRRLGFMAKVFRPKGTEPVRAWVRGDPDGGAPGYGAQLSPGTGRPMLRYTAPALATAQTSLPPVPAAVSV